ncbi:MAG: hypothetical protein IPL61_05150 [Myxococcales bacterium]|nr:hypothetical protein [Myxococcales bacterium]
MPTPPAPSTLPTLTALADVGAHVGAQVEAHGTYAVVTTGRHKIMYTRADGSSAATNKVVRLELDGGAIDLWVRPDDEMTALTGKRVVAIGKLIGPSAAQPGAAAPDARPSLVEISSITAE